MSDSTVEVKSPVAAYREIEAALTAPGAPFEMVDAHVRGATIRTYRHAAPTLYTVVADFEQRFADNTLTVGVGGEQTYREVFERARRFAAVLHEVYGVGPGEHVGIMMNNRADYLIALFAITRIGAVAVLFNSRSSANEIGAAAVEVPCAVIVADPKSLRTLASAGVSAQLIATDAETPATPNLTDLTATPRSAPEPHVSDTDSVCLILFTSGTSGRPKGVLLTHRNICNVVLNMRFVADTNLEFASRTYGIAVEDLRTLMPTVSALLIFPLFHVSGIAALMATMNAGGRVATMPRWDASAAADLIAEYQLSLMAGPPMTVDDLLALPDGAERLGTLLNVVPGGQATPPNVTARIADRLPNARRSAGWGMTEVGGSVCTAGGDILAAHPTTSGAMSPTMDVRVVDWDGAELPAGQVGELQLRGALVMAGYAGRPDDTADAFDGAWLRTGDLGYVDDHGLVYLVDRAKDLVISAGENISCAEVEAALAQSDRFSEVAAFGVPDDRRGERLVAAVTVRDGIRDLDAEAVRDLTRAVLSDYKVPTEVVFDLGPLPRTATGKVVKRELRQRYLARSSAQTKER
ncbi:acyl--CoA ligase [Aldersonia sp. NBC_00410]|uniref:class I adenylate-forming enzyme family protein n=1 Tax=Aldersonia sp. NBC_00410 TaxID=2975954 RepID=UPI00225901EA|nr:class I adenylate-forming enzyme family protein [Aldersonia sp. NBC_00410]MCX5044771.1 acyl--CoA ligase [Aldersonia sp. NBC_00410]